MSFDPELDMGCLYGVGLGPGSPDLITVRAAQLLARVRHVFAPKSSDRTASIARQIATPLLHAEAELHELVYPMTRDRATLARHWHKASTPVVRILESGSDAAFVTLGDPLLYSTFTYLCRAVREQIPRAHISLVPGVTSFSACAALTEFVLGEGDSTLTVAPAPESEAVLDQLIARGGRLVLMKLGAKLPLLLRWMAERELLDRIHLVARAGMPGEQVFTSLSPHHDFNGHGYLATLLVDLGRGEGR